MVRKLLLTIAAGALCLVVASCQKKKATTSSTAEWISSFSVVDSSLSNAYMNSELFYAAKDFSGNIYVNATTKGSGSMSTWKILRSTDQGATWSVVESSTSGYDVSYAIAGDSLGNVFAVGGESTDGSVMKGVVRKFDGTSWSVVKNLQLETGQSTSIHGVAVDSLNNVYVLATGKITNPLSVYQWAILKSTDHGSTWTQIDAFAPQDNSPCFGTNLLVTSSDAIYSSGYCAFGNGQSFVRKSSDHGATWSLVYETWDRQIKGIAEWNNGIIIAVDASSGSLRGHVMVFHTQDDFDHITKLYDSGAYVDGYIGSLRVDPRGYIYLSASFVDDVVLNTSHTSVVGTRDGTWVTLDTQNFTDTSGSQWMNDIFFNNNNQVFYIAPHTDGSGNATLHIGRADLKVTTAWSPTALGNGTDLVSPIPSGAKIVYVTSALTDGRLGNSAAAAITAADALCNSDPNKPTFATGTFKALLVNSARVACTTANCGGGNDEHTNWVLGGSQDYVTRKGSTLGTTNLDGLFTSIANTLGAYSLYGAWTALLNDPSTDWTVDPNYNCLNWTSNSDQEWSTLWEPKGTDLSSIYSGGYYDTCDQRRALVCVEQ